MDLWLLRIITSRRVWSTGWNQFWICSETCFRQVIHWRNQNWLEFLLMHITWFLIIIECVLFQI